MAQQRSLTRNIPADVLQLEAACQLGTLTKVYIPGIPMTGAIAGFLFGLSIIIFIGSTRPSVGLAILFILILTGFFLGLRFIWPTILSIIGTLRVYIFAQGLVYVKKGKREAIRWDQIETFYQEITRHSVNSIPIRTQHRYTIQRADGTVFTFNDWIYKVGELGATLARESTRYLLSKAIATYNNGNPVTFGRLSVNKQGVGFDNEMLLWNQVKDIQIDQGIVWIRMEGDKKGKLKTWRAIKAETVPNPFVFLTLVNTIIKSKQQGTY